MNVIVCETRAQMSEAAAAIIAAQVLQKPESVLGLATGGTPLDVYARLAQLYRLGAVSFNRVTTFNLDEYVGLNASAPSSYHTYMQENLFSKIDADMARVHIPNGTAEDLEAECARYERAIGQAGGIDLQLLGIGGNGHIAFNEPGDFFEPETHVTQLDAHTLEANAVYFGDGGVPKAAITMGVGSIMRAARVLLLACGNAKAQALREIVCGKITPRYPASVLRLHREVTIIAAEGAESGLPPQLCAARMAKRGPA